MVPTGLGAFLSNVLFSVEPRPPSTQIWLLRAIYRGRGVLKKQDGFLKSTHALRAQKCVSKRIISRNTAPLVQFLAPIRSATAGRALTRRPFVDRIGNRRVTDDFVSPATSPATLGWVPKSEKRH